MPKDQEFDPLAALNEIPGYVGGVNLGADSAPDSAAQGLMENRLAASEIELAAMGAEVVPVDMVRAALAKMVGEVTGRLHTLGNSLAPTLAKTKTPAACREKINNKVDEIMERLREFDVGQIAREAAEETRLQKHRRRLQK